MGLFGIKRTEEKFNTKLEATVTRTVADIVTRALSDTEAVLGKIRSAFDLESKIIKLKEEIEKLTIEKGRKDEERERKDREIEHKIGLERKRQEFEVEQARREVMVEVKEKNLKKDKERFEEQMTFHKEAMAEEVKGLRDLVQKLITALPSAEIIANINGDSKKG